MEFKKADCITIVGKRGSGKSHLARKLIKAFPRLVIFDPVNDWADGIIVRSFDDFAKKISELKDEKSFKIIFRFSPDSENKEEIFNQALRLIYYAKNIQAVIDEIQLFSSPHYMPPYLENLYFIGRHHGVGVIAITQRPSRLNKSCLSQSEHVFIGQLHEKNDLSVVADFLNESKDRIMALQPRRFIYYSPTFGVRELSN